MKLYHKSPEERKGSAPPTPIIIKEKKLAGGGGATQRFQWGELPEKSTVLNSVFYILCIISVSFSVYINYRQARYEEVIIEVRKQIEERLAIVESQIYEAPKIDLKYSHRKRLMPITSAHQNNHLIRDTWSDHNEDIKSVVRQLAVKVDDIQRIRRDVSHLKLTHQQSSDVCSCSPGKIPHKRIPKSCIIISGFYYCVEGILKLQIL